MMLLEAIGWTLIHSLWEGAVIAALLAAILLPLRDSRLRYAAGCVAMLAALGAFGFTLARMMPGSAALQVAAVKSFAPTTPGGAIAIPHEPVFAAIVPWLTPIWLAGVMAFALRYAGGFILVQRMRRQGAIEATPQSRQMLEGMRAVLRIAHPVALVESIRAEVPLVIGYFRPVILIPAGLLTSMPAAYLEAVLLHELAHIRRHDYLVNALQRVVEALLFYHPAVWWISHVVRTERENCCDDIVVAVRGDAHQYASALALLEEKRWAAREPALAIAGGSLVKRIRRLLTPQRSHTAWAPVTAALVLMGVLAVTLAAWQSNQPAPDTSTPEMRWLNQDVEYIITPEERESFMKLPEGPEREEFIARFWERRNPPGSPPNAFKQEHYRRIAYANERFSSIVPGWTTDRGRIYIVNGPPDEIEAHPAAGGSPATEEWLYHSLPVKGANVVFKFVDVSGTNDYRLTAAAETPSAALRVGAGVANTKLVERPAPVYPPLALQARISGTVRFNIVISADGRVTKVNLISGHPLLVEAARNAVSGYVYQPTLLNGQPVVVETTVDVPLVLP